ncbi:MAG: geranylgeranyl diphosphate reductase [Alphaproteobacteria bacterium]|nr:geranylgeranyl diphosphate reductase [Alphaproteobacteria bacterium]
MTQIYDVAVVGGGPSGAAAATDLARSGARVALIDKAGRIKPCGGAIPPRLIRDFDIPDELLVARVTAARMVAPSSKSVDMPIDGGFVGMVDRDVFDEWLRRRAALAGADRITGAVSGLERDGGEGVIVRFRPKGAPDDAPDGSIRARYVIAADGARSPIARREVPGAEKNPCVFAYHEIVRSPAKGVGGFDPARCDVWYQGKLSPDFYAWVFPHGDHTSIGVGSAQKGFSLRGAVSALRNEIGMDSCALVRGEGAPIPLKPLPRWDNGRDVVLAGDAAGVVAPASGEGIYYAMLGGRFAAEACKAALQTGDARALAQARKRFLRDHGRVFWILGVMQHFWYRNDKRRERFVRICDDADVQRLTWQAYMNKELVKADPAAHMRIFMKDLSHLFGLAAT